MTQPGPLAQPRLRHLCLMAPRLEPAVDTLQDAFGLAVAFRDPLVAAWGVQNAVMPVGTSFLEVCAPLDADTAAQRFLARRPEGGGYIIVMECDDLARRRARMDGLRVRLVTDLGIAGFHTLQLHPRDTGACMLELNRTEGGGDLMGPYTPAGPSWQDAVACDVVQGLAAIVVRARAPERLASHWGNIIEVPVSRGVGAAPELAMGPVIRFTVAGDDEPEGICAVELFASNPAHAGRRVPMLGLEFRLVERP